MRKEGVGVGRTQPQNINFCGRQEKTSAYQPLCRSISVRRMTIHSAQPSPSVRTSRGGLDRGRSMEMNAKGITDPKCKLENSKDLMPG